MLRGVLLFLAAFMLSAAQPSGNSASGQASASQTTNVAANRPQIVPPRNSQAEQSEKAQPNQRDPYAKERNERERRDIIAQEDAAYWAQSAFWAVIAQTVLAFGALTAIVLDLRQTRLSTERQLRAYVSVQMGMLEIALREGKAYVDILIKNGGQTPAYLCCHNGNILIRTDEEAERDIMHRPHRTLGRANPFTLHMNDPQGGSLYAHEPITLEALREVVDGDKWLYVFGSVFYRDTFGIDRETRFCVKTDDLVLPHRTDPEKWPRKKPEPRQGTWIMADFHNDAT